jgi:hypothetical protein
MVLTEGAPARNNPETKTSARREQIRRLSDIHLDELRRDLEIEARRRRNESAEVIHKGDPGRVRWWRPCAICGDRSCRSQSCRDAERHLARWGR